MVQFDDSCGGSAAKCKVISIQANDPEVGGKLKLKTKIKCDDDEVTDDAYAVVSAEYDPNLLPGGFFNIFEEKLDFCDKYSKKVTAFGITFAKLKFKGLKCPINAGKTFTAVTQNKFSSNALTAGTGTSELKAWFKDGGDLMFCVQAEMEM